MDVKAVAMLGVLAAIGAALRPLGAGTAGLETVFFLLVLGGRVFGAGFGFVLGATTLFASALVTGGVGPWLPFQMLGAAWVGCGAGLLPPVRGRAEVLMLAGYGAVAGLVYGLLLNLSFWPFTTGLSGELSFVAGAPLLENLHRFLVFTLATSLGWDIGRAVTTAVLILVTGRAVLGSAAPGRPPGRVRGAGDLRRGTGSVADPARGHGTIEPMSNLELHHNAAWLSREELDFAREKLPILYVDAVPVRVDDRGAVTAVGVLLRLGADGSVCRELVSGRVLHHERVRDALLRHIEKDLGPMALPRVPASPQPFTVAEYFPTPGVTPFHDPRQHAVSLAFVVPVAGDCAPQNDALDLTWLTPDQALDPADPGRDGARPRGAAAAGPGAPRSRRLSGHGAERWPDRARRRRAARSTVDERGGRGQVLNLSRVRVMSCRSAACACSSVGAVPPRRAGT